MSYENCDDTGKKTNQYGEWDVVTYKGLTPKERHYLFQYLEGSSIQGRGDIYMTVNNALSIEVRAENKENLIDKVRKLARSVDPNSAVVPPALSMVDTSRVVPRSEYDPLMGPGMYTADAVPTPVPFLPTQLVSIENAAASANAIPRAVDDHVSRADAADRTTPVNLNAVAPTSPFGVPATSSHQAPTIREGEMTLDRVIAETGIDPRNVTAMTARPTEETFRVINAAQKKAAIAEEIERRKASLPSQSFVFPHSDGGGDATSLSLKDDPSGQFETARFSTPTGMPSSTTVATVQSSIGAQEFSPVATTPAVRRALDLVSLPPPQQLTQMNTEVVESHGRQPAVLFVMRMTKPERKTVIDALRKNGYAFKRTGGGLFKPSAAPIYGLRVQTPNTEHAHFLDLSIQTLLKGGDAVYSDMKVYKPTIVAGTVTSSSQPAITPVETQAAPLVQVEPQQPVSHPFQKAAESPRNKTLIGIPVVPAVAPAALDTDKTKTHPKPPFKSGSIAW